MGLQFGLLARLTWWEYSWDIVEPITYFVTYGTALIMYGYFVLTKQVRDNSMDVLRINFGQVQVANVKLKNAGSNSSTKTLFFYWNFMQNTEKKVWTTHTQFIICH